MKFTEKIKNKIDNTKTDVKDNTVPENADRILSDDALDKVSGGACILYDEETVHT